MPAILQPRSRHSTPQSAAHIVCSHLEPLTGPHFLGCTPANARAQVRLQAALDVVVRTLCMTPLATVSESRRVAVGVLLLLLLRGTVALLDGSAPPPSLLLARVGVWSAGCLRPLLSSRASPPPSPPRQRLAGDSVRQPHVAAARNRPARPRTAGGALPLPLQPQQAQRGCVPGALQAACCSVALQTPRRLVALTSPPNPITSAPLCSPPLTLFRPHPMPPPPLPTR